MNKPECIIGIDPDTGKSGVAVLSEGHTLECLSLEFPKLLDRLQSFAKGQEFAGGTLVVVEAGWKNASNWHIGGTHSIAAAAKAGQNTGRNHEVARKIAEMSRHYGLDTVEAAPLRKHWKGAGGKITHKELQQVLRSNGFPELAGRTNQEERDAALLAIAYSNRLL